MWDLPLSVKIDGTEYKIRNKCDYRVVLDVISALSDKELDDDSKLKCALYIFYEDLSVLSEIIENSEFEKYQDTIKKLYDGMMKVINLGAEIDVNEPEKPKMMDWEHDYNNVTPPISRVLGYSVRDKNNYTHWYDFIGAYMEIGDCYFAQIVSIRSKIRKGKKLDEQDRQFYKEHKKEIDLPTELSDEEREWLDSDW
nr:MAG TPA: hypothetical protein [Caudoviricetes sp.]